MARPRKEIDQQEFEKLCAMQCTEREICAWFDVSEDTLNRWSKRTYRINFEDIFAQKREKGRISLRRSQFQLAEKSAAMAIFLGKQYLDQKDEKSAGVSVNVGKEDENRVVIYVPDDGRNPGG
jgi:hypothetical protein